MDAYIVDILINGLTQGFIYALMALGYSVIVGVTGLVTFAHGDVIMIGAFTAYYSFLLFGNNVWLGIVASFLASGIVGIMIYKVCYERFLNAPRHIPLICTIGTSMVIKNLAQIVFGANKKPMLEIIEPRFYQIGAVRISSLQIFIFAVVIVLALFLAFFINKTKFGTALRAVSQNKVAAGLMGINVKLCTLVGNVIGCGIAGVAGLLLGLYYQSINAMMGGALGMKAFSAAVLGGMTDTRFSSLGGVLIGLIENCGISLSQASYRDIFAFVFLIIVLTFRPTGFKAKRGTKV